MQCIHRNCLFFYFIFIGFNSFSQSATGLHSGRYSGIHGALVNPASPAFHHMKWDVNLTSIHAFGHTDYAYALNSNLFHFLKNVNTLQEVPIDSDRTALDPDILYYDYNSEVSATTGSTLIDITGPSALVNFERFSIGVFTRMRAQGGSHNIPAGLGYYRFQNYTIGEEIPLEKSKISALFWSEYGISLSSDQLLPFEGWSVGLNIKYLNGHQGMYAKTINDMTYVRNDVDSLSLSSPQVELGFTNTLIEDQNNLLQSNGRGLGIDIGISKNTEYGILNVSILDIGSIKMNNAEMYRVIASSDVNLNVNPLQNASDVRTFIAELDEQVSDELGTNTTYLGDQIRIGLPTRLHADIMYPVKDKIFIGASWDQRIPIRKTMIEAENTISIFPRYESKWWMFSIPMTVYEYQSLRIGAAMRIGFLTLGSDHLFSLFGKSDFRGSSVYASVKLFPFGKKASQKIKGVDCPEIRE